MPVFSFFSSSPSAIRARYSLLFWRSIARFSVLDTGSRRSRCAPKLVRFIRHSLKLSSQMTRSTDSSHFRPGTALEMPISFREAAVRARVPTYFAGRSLPSIPFIYTSRRELRVPRLRSSVVGSRLLQSIRYVAAPAASIENAR